MNICPKCGKTSDEIRFIGPFCEECFEFKIKFPKKLEYLICSKCGMVRMRGKWGKYDQKAVEEDIAGRFRGSFERADYYLDSETAIFYYNIDGKIYEVERKFSVNFVKVNCPECVRKSGGYYEAILQFRGEKKKREFFANQAYGWLKKKTFVSKVVERKEGIDLYVGRGKTVVEFLKDMGWTYRSSRKLSGEKEGKRFYRTTYVVRFE
ncbi:hypothetical protein JXB01_04620 [Candidatus Micrarchaeota archaeon]|nr:hypothetical protein [Candidatus Micrarchaeota archaeon]